MLRVTILTGLREDKQIVAERWRERERGQVEFVKEVKIQDVPESKEKDEFMWLFNKENREAERQTRMKNKQ